MIISLDINRDFFNWKCYTVKEKRDVMKVNSIYAIYFSPTNTSKKSVIAIAQGLKGKLEEIDLTLKNNLKRHQFTSNDIVVVGFPVYGGRILPEALERLKLMQGNNTPCIISVTYGNRHYDDALLELFNVVKELGFIPMGAAALIGQHTYGKIQVGRPNHDDLLQDKLFGSQIAAKLEIDDFSLVSPPGNFPYKEGMFGGQFIPATNKQCNQCGLCVKKCPMQAIDANDCKTINEQCISCFRCISICPLKAKSMDDNQKYQIFAKEFSERLAKARDNEYFM